MATESTVSNRLDDTGGISVRWWTRVTFLLLVVVELCWVVPWYRTVIQIAYVASPLQTSLVLGGVMLAAYLFAQALESLRLIRGLQFGILVFLFLASLIVSMRILLNSQIISVVNGLVRLDPGAVLVVFTVLWIWWRGLTLGREAIKPIVAWRRFELGLLFFMARIFILVRMQGESIQAASELGLFIFFMFAGLLSVVFARISYVGVSKGVHKNPFDRRWFATVISILILTVSIAAVLGGLLSGQYSVLLVLLADTLKILIAVFIFIVSLPWLFLSYLFVPLYPLIRRGLESPTPAPSDIYPLNPGLIQPRNQLPEAGPLPANVVTIIFWILIFLIVLSLLMRARRGGVWSRRKSNNSQESLLKPGEARHLLRKALQDTADGLAKRLRPARRAIAAARVRRIYAHLMDLSAELNNPRAAGQTPLEFLPELGELFTDLHSDLVVITDAYVKVRYGKYPEEQEEVEAVESSWRRIEVEGKRLKRTGQHKLKTAETKEVQRTGA